MNYFLTLDEQIQKLKSEKNYIEIERPCTIEDGIISLSKIKSKLSSLKIDTSNLSLCKFVPASGAATRMFKDFLSIITDYEKLSFLDLKNMNSPVAKSVEHFLVSLEKLSFLPLIKSSSKGRESLDLLDENVIPLLKFICFEEGLNLSDLPKGLLPFHNYQGEMKTPFFEHCSELDYYKNFKSKTSHFTVSENHLDNFKTELDMNPDLKSNKVEFSFQDKETDTVSIDYKGELLYENNELLKRPAGHGALIFNLNKIDYDLILIRNIDNILPKPNNIKALSLRENLVKFHLFIKNSIDKYLNRLTQPDNYEESYLIEVNRFIEEYFFEDINKDRLSLIRFLSRPFRTCMMVKNEGQPGGGPFYVSNKNGISKQIVELTQINSQDLEIKKLLEKATHFNPVDIIISPYDYKQKKYNFLEYMDSNTYIINEKSYKGKNIRVLELPGLWNGAMSDWLTIFVEIPIEHFNPVKTINDLLEQKRSVNV